MIVWFGVYAWNWFITSTFAKFFTNNINVDESFELGNKFEEFKGFLIKDK